MPARLTMELKTDSNNLRYHSAALLHGVVMELVSPEYAGKMHISSLRPYSQSLRTVQGKNIWKLCTLDEEAEKEIISVFLESERKDIYLKHYDETLHIASKELYKTTYQDLIEKYYFADNERIMRLQFCTPCSFKQDGKYVFMPDIHLIYQSLMKRFDSFSENNSIWMEEALEDLASYTEIIGYNLRSNFFSLEGVRIPAFQGNLTIKLHGPQQLVNLAALLFRYGEYSGAGIKTAMGMGNIQVLEKGNEFQKGKAAKGGK